MRIFCLLLIATFLATLANLVYNNQRKWKIIIIAMIHKWNTYLIMRWRLLILSSFKTVVSRVSSIHSDAFVGVFPRLLFHSLWFYLQRQGNSIRSSNFSFLIIKFNLSRSYSNASGIRGSSLNFHLLDCLLIFLFVRHVWWENLLIEQKILASLLLSTCRND